MIKYRVVIDEIEKKEILKETKKQIVYRSGNRETKTCSWKSWHDSFEDAKNYLINKQKKEIESLRFILEREKGKLGQLKGMREEDIKSILK